MPTQKNTQNIKEGSPSIPSVAMEQLFSRVENMHGVINLDAMTTLLQTMLTHMHRQEEIITHLNQQVHESIIPSCEIFREHLNRLDQRLTLVDQKVDKALHASTANLLDTKYVTEWLTKDRILFII
jgi:hypothetical protein